MPTPGRFPELPVQPAHDGWMLTALVAGLAGGLPEPEGAISALSKFFEDHGDWKRWLDECQRLTGATPSPMLTAGTDRGVCPELPADLQAVTPANAAVIAPQRARQSKHFWVVRLPEWLLEGSRSLGDGPGHGYQPTAWLLPLQRVCRGLLQHRLLIEQFERQVICRAEQIGYDFAYGLTHEINNPLANIAARAGQLATQPAERLGGPSGRRALETIQQQAWRAHEMLAELMLAVRPPQLQPGRCDLMHLVTRLLPQLRAAATERSIELTSHLPDRPMWGWIDPAATGECLRALVRNATEACRAGDHIDLWLEGTGDPQYLRLAVHDTGPGLSWAEQQRAWNWYYCGRQAGRGLGLGLSKVRRLIHHQSGQVWIASQPSGGCQVEVRLPCG